MQNVQLKYVTFKLIKLF